MYTFLEISLFLSATINDTTQNFFTIFTVWTKIVHTASGVDKTLKMWKNEHNLLQNSSLLSRKLYLWKAKILTAYSCSSCFGFFFCKKSPAMSISRSLDSHFWVGCCRFIVGGKRYLKIQKFAISSKFS